MKNSRLFRSSTQALLLFLFSAGSVLAEKPAYHLFNPTPADQLREMSTDRPDKTESPFTIDAGHVQIESDLINWTRNRGDSDFDGLDIGGMNFRIGLTQALEIGAVVTAFHYEETRVNGRKFTDEGFGDVTLRMKYNFWGNDGGKTAFGIMPFVTLPAAGGNFGVSEDEYGVIIPLSVSLGEKWGLGLMTEIDYVNSDDGGKEVVLVNSITVGHDLTNSLGAYVEFFSEVPVENSRDWVGSVDVGITYALTDNVQLDAGVNFGVTDAADDLNPFLGISVRF